MITIAFGVITVAFFGSIVVALAVSVAEVSAA
jgi:hypothetical protein